MHYPLHIKVWWEKVFEHAHGKEVCDALLMKSSLGCGRVSRSRVVVCPGNVDADRQISGRRVQVHTDRFMQRCGVTDGCGVTLSQQVRWRTQGVRRNLFIPTEQRLTRETHWDCHCRRTRSSQVCLMVNCVLRLHSGARISSRSGRPIRLLDLTSTPRRVTTVN